MKRLFTLVTVLLPFAGCASWTPEERAAFGAVTVQSLGQSLQYQSATKTGFATPPYKYPTTAPTNAGTSTRPQAPTTIQVEIQNNITNPNPSSVPNSATYTVTPR